MADEKATKQSLKDLPQLPGLTKTHLFPFLRQIDYSNLSTTNRSWNGVANPTEGVRLYLENLKKQPRNLPALRDALRELFNYISHHCPNPNHPDLAGILKNIKIKAPPETSNDTSMLDWEWQFYNHAAELQNSIEQDEYKEWESTLKEWKRELDAIAHTVAYLKTAHFGALETEYPKIIRHIKNLANLPFDQQRKMQKALARVSYINSEASLFKVMKIYFGIEGANNTKAQNALSRLFALSKSKHTTQGFDKEDLILQFDTMREKIIKTIDEAEREVGRKVIIYGLGISCVACCLTGGPLAGAMYIDLNNSPEEIVLPSLLGSTFVVPIAVFGTLFVISYNWLKKNESFADDRILENLGNLASIHSHTAATPSV